VRLELHCHSICSDGSLPPADVARLARARGATLFCLTDHDTDRGYDDTVGAIGEGCTVLRGLELSCREYDRSVHLLLYGLREGPGLERLHVKLEEVDIARRERIVAICARLETLGVHIDAVQLLEGAHARTPGRPDVARALVRARVCTSPREAFDRFLKDGGPADVPVPRISAAEGVALARDAGGRVSLAHPHQLGHPALVRDMFVRLRDAGLEGIEAYYGKYARPESAAWLRLAQELDLVPTGGSDFHGEMSPDVAAPTITLEREVGERILAWLA
jgi:predicted metal-dependent phosphoesterase TrpH